jgi:MFS superfamily sulfate permease-like transporter
VAEPRHRGAEPLYPLYPAEPALRVPSVPTFRFVALYAMRFASAKYKRLAFLRAGGPLIMCLVGICMMWAAPALTEELGIKIVGDIPEGLPPWSAGRLKTGTFFK